MVIISPNSKFQGNEKRIILWIVPDDKLHKILRQRKFLSKIFTRFRRPKFHCTQNIKKNYVETASVIQCQCCGPDTSDKKHGSGYMKFQRSWLQLSTLPKSKTYWHRDFRKFLSDTISHNRPQIQTHIRSIRDPRTPHPDAFRTTSNWSYWSIWFDSLYLKSENQGDNWEKSRINSFGHARK